MRHVHRLGLTALFVVALNVTVFALPAFAVSGNGRLQVIQLDVGQGDGALIISPLGEVAVIDNGPGSAAANQLVALGVTTIKHHFASHYHADHIGGIDNIIAAGITVQNGWDRGGSYTTATYTTYKNMLGAKRRTIAKNQVVTLDSLSAHPVFIKCVDLNAAGLGGGVEENNLCLILKVSYGEFDEVFGGDLPGYVSSPYINVETTVAAAIGTAEAYKVHHHGSATSSNAAWLAAVQPQVGVISCGNGNVYHHPTPDALSRLHAANVRTYWTELGNGVAPDPAWDKVANGQVRISATWMPAGVDTISGNGFVDTFINSGAPSDVVAPVVIVTEPNGGEIWAIASPQVITWTATDNVGVTAVDLAYSTDGGATYGNVIATGIANSGSYNWTVPAAATITARVRVTAHDAVGLLGEHASDADFAISAAPSGVGNLGLAADGSLGVYPNPCGGSGTRILYSVPRAGVIDVSVYDVAGRLVRRLASGSVDSGERALEWDGRDDNGTNSPSGVYLVRLHGNDGVEQSQRLVLFR
jgi:competence protein ComEC